MARVTAKPSEARFRDSTVKVTSHNRVDEASPEAVFFFESLLPDGLDIFVVGLEELIQGSGPSVAGAIESRRLESVARGGEANRAFRWAKTMPSRARS